MSPSGDSSFYLKDLDWIFILWLFLVIIWNYGFPEATPFLDVLAAVGLFFITKFARNYFQISQKFNFHTFSFFAAKNYGILVLL